MIRKQNSSNRKENDKKVVFTRIGSGLHTEISRMAALNKCSINQWAERALKTSISHRQMPWRCFIVSADMQYDSILDSKEKLHAAGWRMDETTSQVIPSLTHVKSHVQYEPHENENVPLLLVSDKVELPDSTRQILERDEKFLDFIRGGGIARLSLKNVNIEKIGAWSKVNHSSQNIQADLFAIVMIVGTAKGIIKFRSKKT